VEEPGVCGEKGNGKRDRKGNRTKGLGKRKWDKGRKERKGKKKGKGTDKVESSLRKCVC